MTDRSTAVVFRGLSLESPLPVASGSSKDVDFAVFAPMMRGSSTFMEVLSFGVDESAMKGGLSLSTVTIGLSVSAARCLIPVSAMLANKVGSLALVVSGAEAIAASAVDSSAEPT